MIVQMIAIACFISIPLGFGMMLSKKCPSLGWVFFGVGSVVLFVTCLSQWATFL